ncbi:MAG: HlyD family efflux transporter periplasmic adaptor subunit [Ideonella sp. WA131b]|jgi:HlyD family secretion protein|nr:HlyD family efflux transporter periplasmic adaptor subunit [Ideonella sp. WA131b]
MSAPIPSTAGQDRALAAPSAWRRRWPWLGALLLLMALALLAGLRHERWGTPRVPLERLTVAAVTVAPLVREVNAEGRVVAGTSLSLVAPATGTVVWQVQAGDAVQAGQLLGKLSSPELEARLSQERTHADSLAADLRRAGAEAASSRGAAQAQVATAELALQAAQWLEKRQRVALDAGASSALQWEAARDALARARIELDQARQSATLKTEALKYELEARQALFQRATTQAQELARQAGLLQLRAPQAGAIGQRLVGDGATVARDAVLLTLVDLTRLDVQLQVPESLVRDLQLGQQGEVMVAGRPVAASLVALSPEVVNGEVAARLRFADGRQPADLRQNQRLSARVLLERRDAVLGVQRGPFIEQGGGRLAWVLKDGVALRRAVQLGAQSLDRVEVKAGLQAGEQVVVGGLESQPADTQTVIVSR